MFNILHSHSSAPFLSCMPEETSGQEGHVAWVGNMYTGITCTSAPAVTNAASDFSAHVSPGFEYPGWVSWPRTEAAGAAHWQVNQGGSGALSHPLGGRDGDEWKVRSSGVPGQTRPCNSVQQAPSDPPGR